MGLMAASQLTSVGAMLLEPDAARRGHTPHTQLHRSLQPRTATLPLVAMASTGAQLPEQQPRQPAYGPNVPSPILGFLLKG